MRHKPEIVVQEENKGQQVHSPMELWRQLAGRQTEQTKQKEQRAPDSLIACYKDRVTYTFIFEGEIASIHFDRVRREIFFSGHNILHLDLTQSQKNALEHVKTALAGHPKAKKLFNDYEATLDRYFADNTKGGESKIEPNP